MKLSIITINKNNAHGLEKTIQSVINQSHKNFEYIVIDGNSTDGSIEIIKEYSNGINYWISESDTGIYNAMNKGIRKAQGDYCLFLNSGDYLVSSTTINNVLNEINELIPADIYYSDCIRSNGDIIRYPEILTINNLIGIGINHQNSLIKRSLFLEHSLYNEKLRIAADQEYFMLESWKYKSKFIHIKTNISIFDIHGIGSLSSPEQLAEDIIVYNNIFQELSVTILEVIDYHRSIYYDFKNYSNSKILLFILRVYKFILRVCKFIIKRIFR